MNQLAFLRSSVKLLFFAIAILVLVAEPAGAAQGPDVLCCPVINVPVKIDGRLDDSGWAKAARLSDFQLIDGTGLAPNQTECWLCLHEGKLYVAWRCFDFDLSLLKAKTTKRDGAVWVDDEVELFLRPPGGNLYQIVVNPNGTILDDEVGGIRHAWNPPVEVATGREKNAWIAELAVPLSSFGVTKTDDKSWRFNVCRSIPHRGHDSPTMYSTYSVLDGSYWDEDNFGLLKFSDEPCFGAHLDMPIDSGANHLSLSSPSGQVLRVNAAVSVIDANRKPVSAVTSQIDSSEAIKFELPSGYSRLNLSVASEDSVILRRQWRIRISEEKRFLARIEKDLKIACQSIANISGDRSDILLTRVNKIETSRDKWIRTWQNRVRGKASVDRTLLFDLRKLAVKSAYLKLTAENLLAGNNENIVVRTESSLVKLFTEKPSCIRPGESVARTHSAGNEAESFQIVLMPFVRVGKVALAATDLRQIDGKGVIDCDNISIRRVGYVQPRRAPYPVLHDGAWPDPLNNESVLDLFGGKTEVCWVTIRTPANTPAGKYAGRITITGRGLGKPVNIGIEHNVWSFSLPARSRLQNVFGIWDLSLARSVNYDIQSFRKKLWAIADDMLDNRITPCPIMSRRWRYDFSAAARQFLQSEYPHYWDENHEPAVDMGAYGEFIEKYKDRLTCFVIGPEVERNDRKLSDKDFFAKVDKLGYDKLFDLIQHEVVRRGWQDLALAYVYDEVGDRGVAKISYLLNIIQKSAPGLKTIVTGGSAFLPSPGKLPFKNIIWCPQTHWIDFAAAKSAADRGETVWWYVCAGPQRPYSNFHITMSAIENRSVFLATFKHKIEGFLYWSVTIWPKNIMAPGGVWTCANGDGFLYYPFKPGSDKPVGSIRLEMVRDGIEDYDYLAQLRAYLESGQKIDPQLAKTARELLNIPENVIKDVKAFTADPDVYSGYRLRLGECISRIAESIGPESKYGKATQGN